MPIPTIVFQTGTSKVQQIVEALNQAIDQGRLSPGAKLPSAREMTEAWGVSKFTLIEALDRLRGQDRITSSQGLGYFVATRGPVAQRAAALDQFVCLHGRNFGVTAACPQAQSACVGD